MIPTTEKIARLLALCNKFKNRVIAYKEESFYDYANVCWSLAYFYSQREQIEGLEMIYEDAGDDSYYDLLGLKIGSEYASIPVPMVHPTVVGTFAKKATIVEKFDHERKSHSPKGLEWEKLAPELTFLALYPSTQDHLILVDLNDLELMKKPSDHILPSNIEVCDQKGGRCYPVHDDRYFKEYRYSGYTFKSWFSLEELFSI